ADGNLSSSSAAAKPAAMPTRTGELDLGGPLGPSPVRGARGEDAALTPISLAAKRTEQLRGAKFDPAKYATIRSLDALRKWIGRAYETGLLALKTETNSID